MHTLQARFHSFSYVEEHIRQHLFTVSFDDPLTCILLILCQSSSSDQYHASNSAQAHIRNCILST